MKPGNISNQRILAEVKKLNNDRPEDMRAGPLPDDLYTWHFTFRGPMNTQFHQGLYHGQILLPYEYPFKPPDIVFMNKNGRFEVNTKICLTITQYHPEEWNSAWTIRTMLEAVISLFAQNVQGVGSLSSSADVRSFLAKTSHNYVCEKCGPIKDILTPRPPPQVKIVQQKEENNQVESKQEKIERKKSQDIKVSQPPALANIFSEQLTKALYQKKKQVFQEIRQPNQKKKYDRPQRQKAYIPSGPVQSSYEPQKIYIKGFNHHYDRQIAFKQYTKQIQNNTKLLSRVQSSIRWVD